ncbi:hypothetical protein [Actinophytocola sediminis]
MLDKATLADEAVAESLRTAADEASETAAAVDQAVEVFVEATMYADLAADRMVYAVWQADADMRRARIALRDGVGR